jgi:hypothetical protein
MYMVRHTASGDEGARLVADNSADVLEKSGLEFGRDLRAAALGTEYDVAV